jgi:hypothetical protein
MSCWRMRGSDRASTGEVTGSELSSSVVAGRSLSAAQNVEQLPSDGELRGEQTVDRELGARLWHFSGSSPPV